MAEFPDWVRAIVLQGRDPDGVLRTIRLDGEGRISAFVVDSSDVWEDIVACGNSELAVRLGSPLVFSQSGRAQFLDDFRYGLNRWILTPQAPGGSIDLSAAYWDSGGYSCALTTPTAESKYSEIKYRRGALPHGKWGISFSYSCVENFGQIRVYLVADDGSRSHEAALQLDDVASSIDIYVPGVGWTPVYAATVSMGEAERFYHVKFTIDSDTGKYDKLWFNQKVIDLSEHSFTDTGAGATPVVFISIRSVGKDAAGPIVYIDSVILTTAEP